MLTCQQTRLTKIRQKKEGPERVKCSPSQWIFIIFPRSEASSRVSEGTITISWGGRCRSASKLLRLKPLLLHCLTLWSMSQSLCYVGIALPAGHWFLPTGLHSLFALPPLLLTPLFHHRFAFFFTPPTLCHFLFAPYLASINKAALLMKHISNCLLAPRGLGSVSFDASLVIKIELCLTQA